MSMLAVLLATAMALAGCANGLPGMGAGVALDTPEKALGAIETRITAVAKTATRASQRGSLSLPEVLATRARIDDATEMADAARALLEAGKVKGAAVQIDLAQGLLTVLEKRLRRVSDGR